MYTQSRNKMRYLRKEVSTESRIFNSKWQLFFWPQYTLTAAAHQGAATLLGFWTHSVAWAPCQGEHAPKRTGFSGTYTHDAKDALYLLLVRWGIWWIKKQWDGRFHPSRVYLAARTAIRELVYCGQNSLLAAMHKNAGLFLARVDTIDKKKKDTPCGKMRSKYLLCTPTCP